MTTLYKQVQALIEDDLPLITNLSNISAILKESINDTNWIGFYLYDGNELILGPFQGRVACTRIPLNRGVCGKAASTRETVVVADVHQFTDHIACDSNSNSEAVIPLYNETTLFGVLDLDSPSFNRFDDTLVKELELIARQLILPLFK